MKTEYVERIVEIEVEKIVERIVSSPQPEPWNPIPQMTLIKAESISCRERIVEVENTREEPKPWDPMYHAACNMKPETELVGRIVSSPQPEPWNPIPPILLMKPGGEMTSRSRRRVNLKPQTRKTSRPKKS